MSQKKAPSYIKRFQKWLDHYEKKEPNWFQLSALRIFKGALQSLRAYIEDSNEPEINWANPFVELQWEVEWDWERQQVLTYTFSKEALRDEEAFTNQIAEATAKHISVYTLQLLTKEAALLKQGGEFTYLLPQDITPSINDLPENEREALLEELYEPFSIGAFDAPEGLPEDGPIPDDVAAQLQKKLADLPSLTIKGEADGVPFEASLIFQFHPLIVDEDERRAYYPIVCGIGFTPVDADTPPADPSTWKTQDQKDFWEQVIEGIEKATEDLITWRPENETEAAQSKIFSPGDRLLTVLSAKHYRDLQDALSKKSFRPMEGTPWPTAPLATGRDFAQLIPPPFETQLLPPDEAEQWAALMFKQQQELSDLDADALDALSSIWLSQAKNPQDDALTDIDLLLSMRGLVPKHKGRGKAFRKQQRQEMLRALSRIQTIWLNMAAMETYQEKGKKIRQAIQSRAFVITDRLGQLRLDGFMDVQKFIFRPGKVFAAFLFGPGRQVALLSSKALEYDPYRQKPEKRLARYLSWHWRTQARGGQFVTVYRVETLLDVVGDEVNRRFPQRTRERLEKALDQLQTDRVIAAWQYERWDEAVTEERKWIDSYLKTTILIEAPDEIKEHYRSIKQLPHKKKAPLPAPEPAAPLDGLGEMLRKERLRRRPKVTQLQMAEILDVTPPYVSQIETGRVTPSAKVQAKIRTWLSQGS